MSPRFACRSFGDSIRTDITETEVKAILKRKRKDEIAKNNRGDTVYGTPSRKASRAPSLGGIGERSETRGDKLTKRVHVESNTNTTSYALHRLRLPNLGLTRLSPDSVFHLLRLLNRQKKRGNFYRQGAARAASCVLDLST